MVEGDRESNVLHKKLILDLESEGERESMRKKEETKEGRKKGVRSRNLTYVYQATVVLTGLIAK